MENLKKFLEKFKNNKLILIILIVGVAFLFIPFEEEENKIYSGEYEKTLTEETERILGKIEGAGKVSVVISFYDRGKTVPVRDISGIGENATEKTISVSGKVAVLKEEYPSVRGVVVVCTGGDRENVKRNIVGAVSALTGAPIHNIKVFKMEG